MWWIFIACTSAPNAEDCQQFCDGDKPAPAAEPAAAAPVPAAPSPAGPTLTAFEQELLNPLLEDIRQGVRAYGDDGIAICEGDGPACDKSLGLSPGELPAGKHHLRAELAVPKSGEKGTWTVDFHLECVRTTVLKDGTRSSTTNQDRQYTVIFAGEDRGYRLTPLWKIESPGKYGAEDCKYKLTMPHPDGDKVVSGSWQVPAPPS